MLGKWQLVFIYYWTVSEYDFKERMNADCNPRGKNLNTLESAKEECKNSKQCQGVLHDALTDPNSYYLCPEDATTTFDNDIKSSLFEKRMIGKIFLKSYTQIIVMIV